MKEPKIQRITFEEIQELYNLGLINYPYNPNDPDDPNNTLMLVYDTETQSFLAVPVNASGNDVIIENAKLTAPITANADFDWVVDKNFAEGMNLQEVMEQLLSPPVPATAMVGTTPTIIDAWNSTDILVKVLYDKGSRGDMVNVSGTYDGALLAFTITSETEASATIPSGLKTMVEGEDYRTVPVVVDIEHNNSSDPLEPGTSTFQITSQGGITSTIVYGRATSNDIEPINSAVASAIDGNYVNTPSISALTATPQKGPDISYNPIANSRGYHWIASTRQFTSWEQQNFELNKGLIADTHRTEAFTTKNVTYYVYTTLEETTYDPITLIFK